MVSHCGITVKKANGTLVRLHTSATCSACSPPHWQPHFVLSSVSLSERQVARLQYNYLAGWWTVNSTPALLALVPIHNLLIYNLRAQPGHHWLILLCTLSLLRLLQCAREVLQPVTPHRHDQCSSLQQQAVVARRVPLSTISFPKQRQTLQTPIQIACHAGMLQVVAM